MGKIAIIGSGFTSYILYKKLEKYNPTVISPKRILKDTPYNRHKKFEINKLNSKKAFSFNNQIFQLNNIYLHDHLLDGGHSNIWGGFCNTENFNKRIFIFLKKTGILLSKLIFNKNGCNSNISTLVQLNDSENNIFSTKKRLKKYIDGFVFNFERKKNSIKLKILINNKNKSQYIYKTFKKVIVAISIPQLISLLKNSDIIKINDILTLEEYQYNWSFKFFNPFPPPLSISTSIDHNSNIDKVKIIFNLFGIIKHYFNLKIKNFINFFPFIYLVQEFQYKKNFCKIKNIKENIFKEIYAKKNFGKSIHVNNLKINRRKIKSFFNKKIEIFGPAAIEQKKPGPISNDIIIDVFKRIY